MTDKTVSMNTPGGNVEYPVLDGSVGPEVIDISKFYCAAAIPYAISRSGESNWCGYYFIAWFYI